MSGAEVLREAAALMRGRAEAATDGPWFAFSAKRGASYVHGVTTDLDVDYDTDLYVGSTAADSIHIAGMSPAVALAVADWLDASADVVDAETRDNCGPGLGTRNALTVARVYLGESTATVADMIDRHNAGEA